MICWDQICVSPFPSSCFKCLRHSYFSKEFLKGLMHNYSSVQNGRGEKIGKVHLYDLIYMNHLYHYDKYSHTLRHHFYPRRIMNVPHSKGVGEKNVIKSQSVLLTHKKGRKKMSAWEYQQMRWDDSPAFFFLRSFTHCSNHSRREAGWHLYSICQLNGKKKTRVKVDVSNSHTPPWCSPKLHLSAFFRGVNGLSSEEAGSFWSQNWVRNHSNCHDKAV